MLTMLRRLPVNRALGHLARPKPLAASRMPMSTRAAKDDQPSSETGMATRRGGDGLRLRNRTRGGLSPFSDSLLDMDPFNIMTSMLPLLPGNTGSLMSNMRGAMPLAMDLTEGDKQFTIKIDIPGVKKEEINLETADDQLTISVDHSEEKDEEEGEGEEKAHRMERSRMSATRTLRLPPYARLDEIRAAYTDGVLKVEVPKAEAEKKSSKVTIQ